MAKAFPECSSGNSNFSKALKLVLEFEGGYVKDPDDPGGATNYGITQKVYSSWKDQYSHVRNITMEEVREIYLTQYWQKVEGDSLPYPIALFMFDFAVHSGVKRAVKTLQQAVDVEEDGIMGVVTLKGVKRKDCGIIIKHLFDERMAFLKSLSIWKKYKNGWSRRVYTMASYDIPTCYVSPEKDNSPQKASSKKKSALKSGGVLLGGGLGGFEVIRNILMAIEYEDYSGHTTCLIISAMLISYIAYATYLQFSQEKDG